MKRYVGFDPSTEGTAYAFIWTHDGRRNFHECGALMSDDSIKTYIARLTPDVVVCIERPAAALHIHDEGRAAARAKASHLIMTARVAGFIAGVALYRGLQVIELAPERWRSIVVGSPHPQDSDVKRAVRVLVPTWPEKSNSHVRDAAGVALGASLLGSVMGRESFA